jgi:hypothetical protein
MAGVVIAATALSTAVDVNDVVAEDGGPNFLRDTVLGGNAGAYNALEGAAFVAGFINPTGGGAKAVEEVAEQTLKHGDDIAAVAEETAKLSRKADDAAHAGNHAPTSTLFNSKAADNADLSATAQSEKLPTCNSFPGDTLVLMADGTHKPIDHIRIGDHVWATNPETGEAGPQPVTAIHRNRRTHNAITLATDKDPNNTLTATEHHPIWVTNHNGWITAENLKIGDQIATTGDPWNVAKSSNLQIDEPVYNLTVFDYHSFHVTASNILVHNCDSPSLTNGMELSTNDALQAAQEFLGPKYTEAELGRFVSADRMRQVRMKDVDILDTQVGPHMNFEIYRFPIQSGVRNYTESNLHIMLTDSR